MPHINLLPWREDLRREKQRQFLSLLAMAAVFSLLVTFFFSLQIARTIDRQEFRNQFLEETIAEVEKEIAEIKTLKEDKKALLARMEVIQKLQRSRPEIVHLFEEIAKSAPKGVYLLAASREGSTLKLEGVANSNDNVSTFMRNLDGSDWLSGPRLDVIDSSKKEYPNSSWFKLNVRQANKSEPTETEKKS